MESGTSLTVTGPAWTLRWAAPELLNAEIPHLASDIWAFAWICWEARLVYPSLYKYYADASRLSSLFQIMTGNFPFYDENNIMVIVRLATGNLPTVGDNQQLSQLQALCSLMTDCWSIEPSKRPTSSSCTEYINRWMVRRKHGFLSDDDILTFIRLGLGDPIEKNGRRLFRDSVRGSLGRAWQS